MKIYIDLPLPPEFLLLRGKKVIYSSCSVLTQLVNFTICLLLSLRNPYFALNLRRSAARRLIESCQFEGVIKVTTRHLADARSYQSAYRIGVFRRDIITEVRGSVVHGRYFHTQRVLAMINRDLMH